MKLIKTDRDILVDYETLQISVASFYNYDSIPTTLFVEMHCLNKDGDVVHELMGTRVHAADCIVPYAFLKLIENLFGFVSRIKQPSKQVVLRIADIETYLILTLQAKYPTTTIERRVKYFRKRLADVGLQVIVKLWDDPINVQYRDFLTKERTDSTTFTPTWRMLGVSTNEEFRKECTKRERLWITKTKSQK